MSEIPAEAFSTGISFELFIYPLDVFFNLPEGLSVKDSCVFKLCNRIPVSYVEHLHTMKLIYLY